MGHGGSPMLPSGYADLPWMDMFFNTHLSIYMYIVLKYAFFSISDQNSMENIDVNIRDHSYQFNYQNYPESPQPLLVYCWECASLENVNILLEMGADTSSLFSYNPGKDPPLPLFFQVRW